MVAAVCQDCGRCLAYHRALNSGYSAGVKPLPVRKYHSSWSRSANTSTAWAVARASDQIGVVRSTGSPWASSRTMPRLWPDRAIPSTSTSGHSLGIVLLDAHGEPVERTTPIWSDARATAQAVEVFADLDQDEWYLRTGNGFTPALYPLFKARWYAKHRPQSWQTAATIVGCKDWLNLWMTGELATDHSYASGSGFYELSSGAYADDFLAAGGVARDQLPEPRRSHDMVGALRAAAAESLGLRPGTPVFAGAVDNSAMALGSRGVTNGRIYASLGSSSWMTVTADRPVLDTRLRPYVFAHVIPGYFVSAMSTFSSGTSIEWLHDRLGAGLTLSAFLDDGAALAADCGVPTFVPTLGGGTPLEGGSEVRGVLAGLDLAHGTALRGPVGQVE